MNGCIYDCGSNSPSTQEYHLYPASASTMDLTLSPGIVCDKCNSYFSKLEDYFVHHHPGSSMRVWNGVVTRKGKTPEFSHQRGKVTRIDGKGGREIKMQLGAVRFDRHPNGDITIVGSYTPRPFDACKISRVLHKIAFEVLVGDFGHELSPRDKRFAPLREYVRRPKSATDFQPFAWRRCTDQQAFPQIVTVTDTDSGDWIADMCRLTFPGVEYWTGYPPWPVSGRVWESLQNDATVVSAPGITALDPEELRIPLVRHPAASPAAGPTEQCDRSA